MTPAQGPVQLLSLEPEPYGPGQPALPPPALPPSLHLPPVEASLLALTPGCPPAPGGCSEEQPRGLSSSTPPSLFLTQGFVAQTQPARPASDSTRGSRRASGHPSMRWGVPTPAGGSEESMGLVHTGAPGCRHHDPASPGTRWALGTYLEVSDPRRAPPVGSQLAVGA